MLNEYQQVCPDQKQGLHISLSKNTIIYRVQEVMENMTTQLVEKVKYNQPFDGNHGDDRDESKFDTPALGQY